MKCLYCSEELEIHPLKTYETFKKSKCQFCKVIYYLAEDNQIYNIVWNDIIIKYKDYVVKIYPGPYTGNAPEFIVYYFNDPHYSIYGPNEGTWDEVLRFNFIPSWTPQNITQHLINYLPFL